METLSIDIDDDLALTLEAVCASQGVSKTHLLADVVRKYLEAEKLKSDLMNSDLAAAYLELATEDVALAEG